MAQKKTRKLLKKLLKSPQKRMMYSGPELQYMEMIYKTMKLAHKRKKESESKGFKPEDSND